MTSDHTIAKIFLVLETKVMRPVHDESVELDEAVLVEQQVESLARRQLALGMLRLHAFFAASAFGLGATPLEELEFFPHCHSRKN